MASVSTISLRSTSDNKTDTPASAQSTRPPEANPEPEKAAMKLTFIGAGGVRTPLVIESVLSFYSRVPFSQVTLMDINPENLELIKMLTDARLGGRSLPFELVWTTDGIEAVQDADFVVMTFRQGGIASRVIDEQVPLKYDVLGQETTGPGGFAMAMRTVPELLRYIDLIREHAPGAWLINFSNPAGMVTEAATRVAGYRRTVGICDNPANMERSVAAWRGKRVRDFFFEYYGLNHLGWMPAIYEKGEDIVPDLIRSILSGDIQWHWLPFDPSLIEALGAIPNEYMVFYYYTRRSIDNIKAAGMSRAMQIQPFNEQFYRDLRLIRQEGADPERALRAFMDYLKKRHGTYMSIETGEEISDAEIEEHLQSASEAAEGYSGVALRLIEALTEEDAGANMILNVPNRGAIPEMEPDDVVEVTCSVRNGVVRPFAMGKIPDHALGLMKRVKAYERLTIDAAVEGSYQKAVKALALHPLVPSYEVARSILNDYIEGHGEYFPELH
jgi:6-phospho-beta-glucosidase